MNDVQKWGGVAHIEALTEVDYLTTTHRASALAAHGAAGTQPGASIPAGTWTPEALEGILGVLLQQGPVVQAFGPPHPIGFRFTRPDSLPGNVATGEAFWADDEGNWAVTFLPDGSVLLLGQRAIDAVGQAGAPSTL